MAPRKSPPPDHASAAFTLIELLVSMTVLVIIVVMVSQLVNSATQVTTGSTKRLDTDEQSRQVFERLTLDLAKMVRRPDADCLFVKLPVSGGTVGHDDKLFFYSEVPAYFDGDTTLANSKSPVALVGYRLNPAFQLERLGKLLTWDGAPTTGSAPGGVMFLSAATATATTAPWIPDPASTLAGNWPNVIGAATDSPPYSQTSDDGDYNVLAEQVFRFEVCYYLQPVAHIDPVSGNLKNISKYSSLPIAQPEGAQGNTFLHKTDATQAPTATDDTSKGYQAGSRWYDVANNRAYICTNNLPNKARWKALGMQDVAGVVVAVAVLDSASSRILPTTQVQISSSGPQTTVPDLTKLNAAFNDLQNDQSGQDNTYPDLSITPPRLMAEAWLNKLNQAGFAQSAGVPPRVASQVRIYQRYIPLNAIQ